MKYTQFKQLHKALKSEINNKAVQILTSVLETKHILTSAEFKIYSNLKLPSEILGWGALFFLLINQSPVELLSHEVQLCVGACPAPQALRRGWPRQPR